MDSVAFDALTRRLSLLAVGAAGIAALGSPIASEGKKKRKKGDVNALCKKQIQPCLDFYESPSSRACCSFFGTCDVTGFYECLLAD